VGIDLCMHASPQQPVAGHASGTAAAELARRCERPQVIDLTSGDPVILRAGKGDPSIWGFDVDGDDQEERSTLLNAYRFPDFEAA
jgi:hypothetical protein